MARKAETTLCPRCQATLTVRGEKGTCPECGLPVRFVDVPERPCASCGKAVPLPPGREAVRCAACGAWQAAEAGRPVVGAATCPRCGREVQVPLDQGNASCPRCGTRMLLSDERDIL